MLRVKESLQEGFREADLPGLLQARENRLIFKTI
jgi:hypothetical protein